MYTSRSLYHPEIPWYNSATPFTCNSKTIFWQSWTHCLIQFLPSLPGSHKPELALAFKWGKKIDGKHSLPPNQNWKPTSYLMNIWIDISYEYCIISIQIVVCPIWMQQQTVVCPKEEVIEGLERARRGQSVQHPVHDGQTTSIGP